jgi:hypothetical protein
MVCEGGSLGLSNGRPQMWQMVAVARTSAAFRPYVPLRFVRMMCSAQRCVWGSERLPQTVQAFNTGSPSSSIERSAAAGDSSSVTRDRSTGTRATARRAATGPRPATAKMYLEQGGRRRSREW